MKQSVLRGTIYLMAAQAAFVASGYAIHISLGRLLGPAEYGIYAVVISLMTMVNLILTTGIPQAVAKYVAHDNSDAVAIKKTALKMQAAFSLVIFAIYFFMAGQIALLLNDASLTPFIRVSALIVPGYAVYSILIGYLNGLREYRKQAVTGTCYSIFKVLFILTPVLIGYAVMGAIAGFIFAPIAGLLVGLYFTRLTGSAPQETIQASGVTARQIVDFAVPIMLFSVATNLIIGVDLFFVKAYLTDYDAGVYAAASMISKVPFYMIGAMYVALFPAISHTTAMNDVAKTRKYIRDSLKYSLMALVPTVLVVSALSGRLIAFLYSGEYVGGGQALGILIIGIGFYSLFFLFTTILNGSGMPRVSLVMSVVVLGLDVLLNFVLVPEYQIIGAAVATSAACFVGMVMAGVYVWRRFYRTYETTQ